MTDRRNALAKLTPLVLSAALDPARWEDFLSELGRLSGGVRTHLFGYDFDSGTNLGLLGSGYDAFAVKTYGDYYYDKNAWAEGFVNADVGVPVHSEWMCSRERLESTEFYNDWIRPQEDIVGGGGVLLFKEEKRMIALGGNIRRKDVGRLEGPWMDLVADLIPFVRHAFEVNRALAGKEVEKVGAAVAQNVRTAIFLLGADRRLVHANQRGEAMLASGDCVGLDLLGRLDLADRNASLRLAEAMLRLTSGATAAPLAFPADRSAEMICRIAQMDASGTEFAMQGIILGMPCERGVLVTISPSLTQDALLRALCTAHHLTQAEAQVAILLADGRIPAEIADERQASIHTVRNQIKAALSKCGVRRQADLVREVERLRQAP